MNSVFPSRLGPRFRLRDFCSLGYIRLVILWHLFELIARTPIK